MENLSRQLELMLLALLAPLFKMWILVLLATKVLAQRKLLESYSLWTFVTTTLVLHHFLKILTMVGSEALLIPTTSECFF